ncbi:hypothetical protein SCHPADRAFT_751480 [Schizopora paradoxa]|uniref:Uncharacterized protein n=1 Tax=Schizopora paradoxa TaxID=27342 RepID=A0A0H2RI85_9AGAM|nr:hypothetical protein SCHPADRAFT_751480 [Schizopora paradoxa]
MCDDTTDSLLRQESSAACPTTDFEDDRALMFWCLDLFDFFVCCFCMLWSPIYIVILYFFPPLYSLAMCTLPASAWHALVHVDN